MKIKFWGTRGSLPTPLKSHDVRAKIKSALTKARNVELNSDDAIENFLNNSLTFQEKGTFGGDTSCVEIDSDNEVSMICDAGSGLRCFGNHVLATFGPAIPRTYHIFMSHLHWDHMMGFPFFGPAFIPGNKVIIHSCHTQAKDAFHAQNSTPGFPVPFSALGSDISFETHTPGTPFNVNGFDISAIKQNHGGDSFGYRFNKSGKSVVYSTDSEHKEESINANYPFVTFIEDADLLIFDAQYSLAEAVTLKEDWGHSSNIIGVELAQRARVKRLCLYHHEPNYGDDRLSRILEETIRYEKITEEGNEGVVVEILSSYDGYELEI